MACYQKPLAYISKYILFFSSQSIGCIVLSAVFSTVTDLAGFEHFLVVGASEQLRYTCGDPDVNGAHGQASLR